MSGNDPTGAWRGFSAFQVFGDHVPMQGFVLVDRIYVSPRSLRGLLLQRAAAFDPLDPQLAVTAMRAGLGVLGSGAVSFALVSPEEVVVLLRAEAVAEAGQSMAIHDELVSRYAARMALLVGAEVQVNGEIYEFPNVTVARRAFQAAQEALEESTPLRSSVRLGVQLQGRGEPFHPSMLESLEEQTALLEANGVDINALPTWWWRGVAARSADGEAFEIFDELPLGAEFGQLLA